MAIDPNWVYSYEDIRGKTTIREYDDSISTKDQILSKIKVREEEVKRLNHDIDFLKEYIKEKF